MILFLNSAWKSRGDFDANPIQSTDSIPFREMAKDFKGVNI